MISQQGCDLVQRLLHKNGAERITAVEILKHPWIVQRDLLPEYHLPVDKITRDQHREISEINNALRPTEKETKPSGLPSQMKLNMTGNLIKKRGKKPVAQ